MQVRLRVALFFAAMMAIVLAAAGALLLSRMQSELRSAVDSGLRSRAAIILRDVREEFADVGKSEGVIDESEVIAQILSPQGQVLETTSALGSRSLLSRAQIDRINRSTTVERDVQIGRKSEPVRVLAVRGANDVVVVVGASIQEGREALSALARLLWLGGPIVLVLTSAAVWALTGVALRPVDRLRAEAEALSFGIDGHRLPVPATRDEISRLAETLNHMLARIEQALERERRFVDDASHELRTPLAVLKTELELALRRSRSRDELEAAIRSAAEEVDGLARLAEHLLILARADRGLLATSLARTNLSELVDQVRATFQARAESLGIELGTGPSEPVWSDVDSMLLRQALTNLVDNALVHTPSGGKVWFDVRSGRNGTSVGVLDSGPGFAPELLPVVFEPFTHADGARGRSSGTGLGLAIVQAIAHAHGGSADAANRAEGGAAVMLRLPN